MTTPTKQDFLNAAFTFERWSMHIAEFSQHMARMAEAAHNAAATLMGLAEQTDEKPPPEVQDGTPPT